MDLNFEGAPWREQDEKLKNLVAEVRRTNGSIPALKEVFDWADKILEDVEKIKDRQSLLLFLLEYFELKRLKPKKAHKKNKQPK